MRYKKGAISRKKWGMGGRLKTRRDGLREIGEEKFWEIAKMDFYVFLSLMRLMLKIFQFVMKINMN